MLLLESSVTRRDHHFGKKRWIILEAPRILRWEFIRALLRRVGGASRKSEDEAIQFVCLGKNIKADKTLIECDDGRFVRESHILGENNIGTVPMGDSDGVGQDKVLDSLFEIIGLNLDDSHLTKDPPGVDAVSTGLDLGECVGRTDKAVQPSSNVIEDILTMGFKNNELTQVVNRESESEEYF
ncbi:hypothetical protein V6N13_016758 [Hibiscus sabdariffa]